MVEHHFVVYGTEDAQGRIRLDIEAEGTPSPDGTLWDPETEEWRQIETGEEISRDVRIGYELERRLDEPRRAWGLLVDAAVANHYRSRDAGARAAFHAVFAFYCALTGQTDEEAQARVHEDLENAVQEDVERAAAAQD